MNKRPHILILLSPTTHAACPANTILKLTTKCLPLHYLTLIITNAYEVVKAGFIVSILQLCKWGLKEDKVYS